jgi:hypothetical protein
MLTIDKTEVFGWEAAIRGMRNPMNSWDKSDSDMHHDLDCDGGYCGTVLLGDNDYSLMQKLRNAGTDHRKFMRMITVYLDITAPLYWWKEFDTYKVGTVANSCSTMHKIHSKEFTLDDFSHEHLFHHWDKEHDDEIVCFDGEYSYTAKDIMTDVIIHTLNHYRYMFLETKDKAYWWQMIQLLPSSYNQKRTVMLNYEVLANMYHSRKNHKLDEWHTFCDWIEGLPYSDLIIGGDTE